MLWHLFLHWTGADNVSGPEYGFWSGFGSDLSEITLLVAMYALLRKHNCHQKRCWRIGRHVVNGTPWCNRHHQAARGGLCG